MQLGHNPNTAVKSWRDSDRDGFKKNVLMPYMCYLQENYGGAGENMAGLTTKFGNDDLSFMDIVPLSSSHTESPFANMAPTSQSPEPASSPSSFHSELAPSQLPPHQHPIQWPLSISPPLTQRCSTSIPSRPKPKPVNHTTNPNHNPFASSSLSHLAPPPGPLPTLLAIYPYLEKHLNSLEPDVSTVEINKMLRLSVYECNRENNIHLNKELLTSINILPLFTQVELQGLEKKWEAKEAEERQKRCSDRNEDFEPDNPLANVDPETALSRTTSLCSSLPASHSSPPLCPLAEPSSSLTMPSEIIPNKDVPAPSPLSNLSTTSKNLLSDPTSHPPNSLSTNEHYVPLNIPVVINTKSWPDWLQTWYGIFLSLIPGLTSLASGPCSSGDMVLNHL